MNEILREKLRQLPDKPGCYIYRDRAGTIIYVGKAVNLRRRVQSYFRASTLRSAPPKLRSLVNHVFDMEIRVVKTEADALLTESHLIKQYKPRFNILLRDDKRYLALRADRSSKFPRITTCRIIRNDGAEYFGPFPSATLVKTALDFTEKRFGLRKCTALRPDVATHEHCMADIIRFCSAPCLGKISESDYLQKFNEACAFLRGERPQIVAELKQQMEKSASEQRFEKAAILRDTWLTLCKFMKDRARVIATPQMHREDAEEGIAELADLLSLPRPPVVIECMDISHLAGSYTVASLVVAVDGIPDKRRYRRFHIKTVNGIDDPKSIAEVVKRHYSRLLEEDKPLPDLIVVDGGITQLRAARCELALLGLSKIRSIGIAERFEELVTDDNSPNLSLPRSCKALQVIMRLRDEAHRFAITFNRRLRLRAIKESALDEIPGIGENRKSMLLKTFGSIYRLAKASEEEIANLPGMNLLLAQTVKTALKTSTKKNPIGFAD